MTRPILVLLAALAVLPACNSDNCQSYDVEIGAACLPDTARAGSQLVIEVREACGVQCALQPTCTALLREGAVQLTLNEDRCVDVNPIACSGTLCEQRVVNCRLPALAAGDYPVVLAGSPDRVLRVREGGDVACRLPQPAGDARTPPSLPRDASSW